MEFTEEERLMVEVLQAAINEGSLGVVKTTRRFDGAAALIITINSTEDDGVERMIPFGALFYPDDNPMAVYNPPAGTLVGDPSATH